MRVNETKSKNIHIIELRGGQEARRSHTHTHTHASPHATMPPTYRSFKRDPLRPVLVYYASAGKLRHELKSPEPSQDSTHQHIRPTTPRTPTTYERPRRCTFLSHARARARAPAITHERRGGGCADDRGGAARAAASAAPLRLPRTRSHHPRRPRPLRRCSSQRASECIATEQAAVKGTAIAFA